MTLIIIYENIGEIPKKELERILSCVLYTLIYNYVSIAYLSCQSKTLSDISINPIFKDTSFNTLLSIGILELLLNLVYCHRFMMKPNSTVVLN